MIRLLKKNITILIFLISVIAGNAQRFDTFSFYNIRKLDPENISQVFTYVEENRTELENTFFIPYIISDKFEKEGYFNKSFIMKLFDIRFFLMDKFRDYSVPDMISNFTPKFDRKALFADFFRQTTKTGDQVFFLFVNTNPDKDMRYYIMEDSVRKLRDFNVNNIAVHEKKPTVILFLDTDYQDFRKICSNCDFIDIIINFQNYEKGNIFGKQIFNINSESNAIDRFDMLFGKSGFLSIAQTEIQLENIEPSVFVNRILKARNTDEKK